MLVLREHEDGHEVNVTHAGLHGALVRFNKGQGGVCVKVREVGDKWRINTHYYVGAGWLKPGELPVQVQPKLNAEGLGIDHMAMLFTCLRDPQVGPHVGDLYELDLDAPLIALRKQDDILTPLLVAHYLHLAKDVVRQGLRKGYHTVNRELKGRVKGKIEVGKTLRQGVFRGRPLTVACAFDEFSFDIPANQILKRALRFAERYLHAYPAFEENLLPLLRYCTPAFEGVSDVDGPGSTIAIGRNPLYRSYDEALRVGQLLLQRFGFSLQQVAPHADGNVMLPPHWLDMSRLFELYVLGLLRAQFGSQILYGRDQAKGKYGLPDYLLTGDTRWIIDAKYKQKYQWKDYVIDDVRQISGYARDIGVLERLGYLNEAEQVSAVVHCLIVYPKRLSVIAPSAEEIAGTKFPTEKELKKTQIPQFTRFYKWGIPLPQLSPRLNL